MGNTYPFDQRDGAEERLRWYQAAVVVAPRNVAAHINLGHALNDKDDLDGAVAEFREALRLDPKSGFAHLGLGWTLNLKGDTDGAVAACREAIRLDPKLAYAHNLLGDALRGKGDLDGAAAAYNEAIRLDPKIPCARNNLRQTERWNEWIARLPDVAAGRAEPMTPTEGCEFAFLCGQPFRKRHVLAVHLYRRAFVADPKLPDDLAAAHRYNAACCAALAAAGKDAELTTPGTEEWGFLTDQARAWLRADLALWTKQTSDPKNRPLVRRTLNLWKRDAALAAVRDPAYLAAMPPGDRQAWQAFWSEADAVLAAAAAPPP